MKHHLLVSAVIAGLCLPPSGCGLFRRRGVNTNVSSNVEVNQQGRDIATLSRDEYEIVDTSIGEDKQVGVYLLTIPLGQQTSKDEGVDSAYYAAVDRLPECDSLLMPRVSVKRVLIPLLIVNIVIRKTRVKGRCVHLKAERNGVANERGVVASAQDAPKQDAPEQDAPSSPKISAEDGTAADGAAPTPG